MNAINSKTLKKIKKRKNETTILSLSEKQRHIQNGVAWLNENQKLAESPEDQRLMRYETAS